MKRDYSDAVAPPQISSVVGLQSMKAEAVRTTAVADDTMDSYVTRYSTLDDPETL